MAAMRPPGVVDVYDYGEDSDAAVPGDGVRRGRALSARFAGSAGALPAR